MSPLVGPAYSPAYGPPYGPLLGPLVTFLALFLLYGAAAAAIQLELVAAARAAIAKIENFMVVVVGYAVVWLIIMRELQFDSPSVQYSILIYLTSLLQRIIINVFR